jgi:hypothetical protein
MDAKISSIAQLRRGKDGTKARQTFVYSGVDITPELKRLTSAFTKVFLFA